MGFVVFRSTTPWVAVSSRKSSNLLTVISMVVVPAADAMASTGITQVPRQMALLSTLPYIKTKTHKTSSKGKPQGKVQSGRTPGSSPQLLGQFVQQPVQIFVGLADGIN